MVYLLCCVCYTFRFFTLLVVFFFSSLSYSFFFFFDEAHWMRSVYVIVCSLMFIFIWKHLSFYSSALLFAFVTEQQQKEKQITQKKMNHEKQKKERKIKSKRRDRNEKRNQKWIKIKHQISFSSSVKIFFLGDFILFFFRLVSGMQSWTHILA